MAIRIPKPPKMPKTKKSPKPPKTQSGDRPKVRPARTPRVAV